MSCFFKSQFSIFQSSKTVHRVVWRLFRSDRARMHFGVRYVRWHCVRCSTPLRTTLRERESGKIRRRVTRRIRFCQPLSGGLLWRIVRRNVFFVCWRARAPFLRTLPERLLVFKRVQHARCCCSVRLALARGALRAVLGVAKCVRSAVCICNTIHKRTVCASFTLH